VLFLATARVIHAVQDAPKPPTAIDVTVIGHQFWWEYRYPKLGVVTANELHIPVSDPTTPTPTFLKLLSADTDHSFWIPQLGGKTDLIPNHPTKCGWTRIAPASFWASARSIAAPARQDAAARVGRYARRFSKHGSARSSNPPRRTKRRRRQTRFRNDRLHQLPRDQRHAANGRFGPTSRT
jgi:hypothetical protein